MRKVFLNGFFFLLISGLQDGMQNKWDSELISEIIKEYVVKQKIDTVSYFSYVWFFFFDKMLKSVFDRLLHLMDTVYLVTLIIFQVITEQGKFFFGGTVKK